MYALLNAHETRRESQWLVSEPDDPFLVASGLLRCAVKCPPQAHVFEHLAPKWYCLEKLWPHEEAEPHWKKWAAGSWALRGLTSPPLVPSSPPSS